MMEGTAAMADFDFGDDLDRLINSPKREPAQQAQPQKFTCAKCNGTGRVTFGYVNRRTGDCFACGGRGFHKQAPEVRLAANAKRKQTIAQRLADNQASLTAEHPVIVAAIREHAHWNTFLAAMRDQFEEKGTLTDNQVAACYRIIAKIAARREERTTEQKAKSGAVDISAINKLFETAQANGLKAPKFRTEECDISIAKRHPGRLYVKARNGDYLGKIEAGRFIASSAATATTLSAIEAVAVDPMKAAVDYGRKTGVCCCCGRELTDPESVTAGIGPICATKWGL